MPPETTNKKAKTATRRTFGVDSDVLIDRLEKKTVRVVLTNGDELVGVLIGATPYTLTLLLGDVPTVVNKGAMSTLQPVARNGDNGKVAT